MTRTARVDPDANRTTVLGDGIAQIRLPMRGNPLRYVNAYVVEDDDGLTLIDCGWKTDDVLAALHEGLSQLGRSLGEIRRLLITHFHFDHYGLAGTLLRAGVPDLAMHAADWEIVQRIYRDPAAADRASDAWLERNGLRVEPEPEEESHRRRSELAQPTLLLEDDAAVGRLRAVWTPGHSPGHLCFLDERTGKLFSGDHILDPITPHVGIWFDFRGDPLGTYAESVRKVEARGATGVLPAHGEPFPDLARRCTELLAHQDVREEQVLRALDAAPATAADVARAIPWTRSDRPFEELPEPLQQFAVAETIAHLEYSLVRGLVTREAAATPILYTRLA